MKNYLTIDARIYRVKWNNVTYEFEINVKDGIYYFDLYEQPKDWKLNQDGKIWMLDNKLPFLHEFDAIKIMKNMLEYYVGKE